MEMPVGKSTRRKGQVMFEENRSAGPKSIQNRIKVVKRKLSSLTKQRLSPFPKTYATIAFSYHLHDIKLGKLKNKREKGKKQRKMVQTNGKGVGTNNHLMGKKTKGKGEQRILSLYLDTTL